MEKFQQLLDQIHSLEGDFQKFYVKEQAIAGTRLRKGLGDLKKLAQEIRTDIQTIKVQRKGSETK